MTTLPSDPLNLLNQREARRQLAIRQRQRREAASQRRPRFHLTNPQGRVVATATAQKEAIDLIRQQPELTLRRSREIVDAPRARDVSEALREAAKAAELSAKFEEAKTAVEPFRNEEGGVDVVAALDAGVSEETLGRLFDSDVIERAQLTSSQLREIEPFRNVSGEVNLVEAIESNISEETLAALFEAEAITQARGSIQRAEALRIRLAPEGAEGIPEVRGIRIVNRVDLRSLGFPFGAGDVIEQQGRLKRIEGANRTRNGRLQIFFTDGTDLIAPINDPEGRGFIGEAPTPETLAQVRSEERIRQEIAAGILDPRAGEPVFGEDGGLLGFREPIFEDGRIVGIGIRGEDGELVRIPEERALLTEAEQRQETLLEDVLTRLEEFSEGEEGFRIGEALESGQVTVSELQLARFSPNDIASAARFAAGIPAPLETSELPPEEFDPTTRVEPGLGTDSEIEEDFPEEDDFGEPPLEEIEDLAPEEFDPTTGLEETNISARLRSVGIRVNPDGTFFIPESPNAEQIAVIQSVSDLTRAEIIAPGLEIQEQRGLIAGRQAGEAFQPVLGLGGPAAAAGFFRQEQEGRIEERQERIAIIAEQGLPANIIERQSQLEDDVAFFVQATVSSQGQLATSQQAEFVSAGRQLRVVEEVVNGMERGDISIPEGQEILRALPSDPTEGDIASAERLLTARIRIASTAPILGPIVGPIATFRDFPEASNKQRALDIGLDALGSATLVFPALSAAKGAGAVGTSARLGVAAGAIGTSEIIGPAALIPLGTNIAGRLRLTREGFRTARQAIRVGVINPVEAAAHGVRAQIPLPITRGPRLRLMGLETSNQTNRVAARERYANDIAAVDMPEGLWAEVVQGAIPRQRATVIIDTPEQGILLVRGKGDKNWILPGGGTEGDSPATAALRELNEELGISDATLREISTFRGAGDASDWRGRPLAHTIFEGGISETPTPSAEIAEIAFWKPGSKLQLSTDTKEILEARAAGRSPISSIEGIGVTPFDIQRATSAATLAVIRTGRRSPTNILRRNQTPTDFQVDIRPSTLHDVGKRGFAFSGTPDGRIGMLSDGFEVDEGLLWFSATPHSRFTYNTSTGAPVKWTAAQAEQIEALGIKPPRNLDSPYAAVDPDAIPTIYIFTGDELLSQLQPAAKLNGRNVPASTPGSRPKLHKGQAESEAVAPQGLKTGPAIQRFFSRDDVGNRIQVLVFGTQPLSAKERAALAIKASYASLRNVVQPGIRWNYLGTDPNIAADVRALRRGQQVGTDIENLDDYAGDAANNAARLLESGYFDEAADAVREGILARRSALRIQRLPRSLIPTERSDDERLRTRDASLRFDSERARIAERGIGARARDRDLERAAPQEERFQSASQIARLEVLTEISQRRPLTEAERTEVDRIITTTSREILSPIERAAFGDVARISGLRRIPGISEPPRVPTVTEPPRVPTVTEPPRIPTVTEPPRIPRIPEPPRVPRVPTITEPPRIPRTPTVPTITEPPKPPPPPVRIPRPSDDDDDDGRRRRRVRVVGINRGVLDTTVDLTTGRVRTFSDLVEVPEGPTRQTFTQLSFGFEKPTIQRVKWGALDLFLGPNESFQWDKAGGPFPKLSELRPASEMKMKKTTLNRAKQRSRTL